MGWFLGATRFASSAGSFEKKVMSRLIRLHRGDVSESYLTPFKEFLPPSSIREWRLLSSCIK